MYLLDIHITAETKIKMRSSFHFSDAFSNCTHVFSNCYPSSQVRAYAVSVLERADDEELQCYLLQLVQALRFERSDKSRLSHFLVQRGMRPLYILHMGAWVCECMF